MLASRISRRHVLGALGVGALGAAAPVTTHNAAWAAHPPKSGPGMVCYVEVNSHSIANVGRYMLAESKANVFDIGIIFASNINYDGTRAVLSHNENVQRTLDNANDEIRVLQKRGIKVLLSILGNHQGAGICNFPDYAAADDFAAQLADAVLTYGLDGIDFDDEWAKYGTNGTGLPNAWSFVYLVQALRARLPDKMISLYWYGPVTERLSYNGINAGDYIDISCQALYGSYGVPDVPQLSRASLAPAAVNLTSTSVTRAVALAERTVAEGYGLYNTYNLVGEDSSEYLSAITTVLNGEATKYRT